MVECADYKITHKYQWIIDGSMEYYGNVSSGFGVTPKLKWKNHSTRSSNFDVLSLKEVKIRLGSVCEFDASL